MRGGICNCWLRRMLREALRSARPAIESYDVILRLKRGAPRAQFAGIAAEAAQMLTSLVNGMGGR